MENHCGGAVWASAGSEDKTRKTQVEMTAVRRRADAEHLDRFLGGAGGTCGRLLKSSGVRPLDRKKKSAIAVSPEL
jgi:hypothetical protein